MLNADSSAGSNRLGVKLPPLMGSGGHRAYHNNNNTKSNDRNDEISLAERLPPLRSRISTVCPASQLLTAGGVFWCSSEEAISSLDECGEEGEEGQEEENSEEAVHIGKIHAGPQERGQFKAVGGRGTPGLVHLDLCAAQEVEDEFIEMSTWMSVERKWRSARDRSDVEGSTVRSKTAHPFYAKRECTPVGSEFEGAPEEIIEEIDHILADMNDSLRRPDDGVSASDPVSVAHSIPKATSGTLDSEDQSRIRNRYPNTDEKKELDQGSTQEPEREPVQEQHQELKNERNISSTYHRIDYDSIPVGGGSNSTAAYLAEVHADAEELLAQQYQESGRMRSVHNETHNDHQPASIQPAKCFATGRRVVGNRGRGGRPLLRAPASTPSMPSTSMASMSSAPTAMASDLGLHGQLDRRVALQSALRAMATNNWESKVEGLRGVSQIAGSRPEAVQSEMQNVSRAVLVEVANLRSQVSRTALQTMAHLFQHCSKAMEQDLDRTAQLLLHKTGDTNRFIRDDAHLALMAMVEYVAAPRVIVAICTEGVNHKNATVRAEAARLLATVVDKVGGARILSGVKDITERILPAMAQFLQDGNPQSRAEARRMLSSLMMEPVFDKALQKYLSTGALRAIQRSVDILRSKVM